MQVVIHILVPGFLIQVFPHSLTRWVNENNPPLTAAAPMLTLYDVLAIADDPVKLKGFLEKYGLVSTKPAACTKCGGPMATKNYVYRGRHHYRCGDRACAHRMYPTADGILDHCRLSAKEWLLLAYFWAHDCAGLRSRFMLGHGSETVAHWSSRFRQCVLNQQAATLGILGGHDVEVEADETEIGRKKKGIHGHPTSVKADVRGVFERSTGRIWLDLFDKVRAGPEYKRRFGPPNPEECDALFQQIAPGSIVMADGARAYIKAAKDHGLLLFTVDHQQGEFHREQRIRGRLRSISTQGIDGTWGRLKTWLKARGGAMPDQMLGVLKEYQWRANLKDNDPFVALVEHIRDGFFQ